MRTDKKVLCQRKRLMHSKEVTIANSKRNEGNVPVLCALDRCGIIIITSSNSIRRRIVIHDSGTMDGSRMKRCCCCGGRRRRV